MNFCFFEDEDDLAKSVIESPRILLALRSPEGEEENLWTHKSKFLFARILFNDIISINKLIGISIPRQREKE